MKTKQAETKTSRKQSAPQANDAVETAFRKLCDRAAEESRAAREASRAEKYKQWRGAAKRFKGLSESLRLRIAFRNVSLAEQGYHVSIMRGGKTFNRFFAGHSEETLAAALKFRDEALKILGEKPNPIPSRVLKILSLSAPVPGISRDVERSVYEVRNPEAVKAAGQTRFSFKYLAEEDAYAAAIECLEASLKSK